MNASFQNQDNSVLPNWQSVKRKNLSIISSISVILLISPYACMLLWLSNDFFASDFFFLFGVAMISFLPAGVFALITNLLLKCECFAGDIAIFILSILSVVIGIFAWMAIYIVTR